MHSVYQYEVLGGAGPVEQAPSFSNVHLRSVQSQQHPPLKPVVAFSDILLPSDSTPTYSASTASTSAQVKSSTPLSQPTDTSPSYQSVTIDTICTVHMSGSPISMSFKCTHVDCHDVSYACWADFSRHFKGAHDPNPPKFWCPSEHCMRNRKAGDYWFTRRDKRDDHVPKMHRS